MWCGAKVSRREWEEKSRVWKRVGGRGGGLKRTINNKNQRANIS